MNVILDYGLGNIRSLMNWFLRAGMQVEISSCPEIISRAELLILPGVGAYRDAMIQIKSYETLIKTHVGQNKPLIGICLGMQLLFERSYENGIYEGLKLLPGDIIPFKSEKLKIPHMGWNTLKGASQFNNKEVYFVHSYYLKTTENIVLASADYGLDVPGVVRKNNVLGFQFHPEKSGRVGEGILEYIKEFKNEYIPRN